MELMLIQYKPNNRISNVIVSLPDESELIEKDKLIRKNEFIYGCEVLCTGEVAIYITHKFLGVDVCCDIADNTKPGDGNIKTPTSRLIAMIKRFDLKCARKEIKYRK